MLRKVRTIKDAVPLTDEYIAPDPEASNLQAAEHSAIVEEMISREPVITSGFGVFTFDPNSKIPMTYHGIYYEAETAQASALSIEKPIDALNVVIPISFFC